MIIAFTTVTFRNKSIDEIFDIARENHINYIEWGGDTHLKVGDDATLDYIATKSIEYNIKALSYGSYYRLGEHDYDKFMLICGLANGIGATVIRIWIGSKPSKKTSETEFIEMTNELTKLCEIADKYKLKIAGEFHSNTYNDNSSSAIKLIQACKMPNYGTYWQSLERYGRDKSNLTELLPYLLGVHVFNQKNYNIRYPLNHKQYKWKSYIDIIKSRDDLPLILEFVKNDDPAIFKSDTDYLRTLVKEFSND